MMGLGGLMAVGGGAGWLTDQGVQRLVIPRHGAAEPWMNAVTERPGDSGFRLQRFPVTTADHLRIEALLLEPTATAGTTKRGQPMVAALKEQGLDLPPGKVRGTVVLLHGFNGRKENMLPFAERFCAAGFRCVLFDSRGHGDSGGRYATFGSREADDLQRVIAAARPLAGTAGFGPLGMLGYSMGGAVALQAQPHLPEVKALASIAAFADFRDIITIQAGRRWQGLGGPLVPLVRGQTRWRAGFDPWDIRPVEAGPHLTCPVFLAHGAEDALVPVSQVHRLATAAGANLRQLKVVPGGTHGGVFMAGGDALWADLVVFFASEMSGGGPLAGNHTGR